MNVQNLIRCPKVEADFLGSSVQEAGKQIEHPNLEDVIAARVLEGLARAIERAETTGNTDQ